MTKEAALKEMEKIEKKIVKMVLVNNERLIFEGIKERYQELKEIVEKPERWLTRYGRYFYSHINGDKSAFIYTRNDLDKEIIINKKAFFTKEEAELDSKCHRILSIATCDGLHNICDIWIVGNPTGIKWEVVICKDFLVKYMTNNKEKLQAAIEEIGQEDLDTFHNLKPILPCECEGMEV